MSRAGIYDEAEIFNRDSCKKAQRELYVKLALSLLYFFVFLYKCVHCVSTTSQRDPCAA